MEEDVTFMLKGRVMALDLGSKRIGVAVSDPTRLIASSYGVVLRSSRQDDFARYLEIIAEQEITLLVVGLPTRSDGSDSDTAVWIRDYMAEFSLRVELPIVFWDESHSTVRAEQSLHLRGRYGKKAKERIDAVAAAIILQDYLDAHSV